MARLFGAKVLNRTPVIEFLLEEFNRLPPEGGIDEKLSHIYFCGFGLVPETRFGGASHSWPHRILWVYETASSLLQQGFVQSADVIPPIPAGRTGWDP
jgi:hypothetical protein